jgi:hypothetical protein
VFCTKKGYFLESKRSLPANNLIRKNENGENPTSQSPTVSPRQQFPPALKRKKLLESGFENEAGNEKRGEGKRVD